MPLLCIHHCQRLVGHLCVPQILASRIGHLCPALRPVGESVGSMRGRFGFDVWSMRGEAGGDLESIRGRVGASWCRTGVILGAFGGRREVAAWWVWDGSGVELGSIGVDLGSIFGIV